MCSFTITNKLVDLETTNYWNQKRGPDSTDIVEVNGVKFLHNLLHITGDITKQPIRDGDVVCVFNGEIYNYTDFGSYTSDAQCLIPLYKEHGLEFGKMLDGEFAIAIVDFENDKLIMVNDTFATKPLWFQKDDGRFTISSYQSSIQLSGYERGMKLRGNSGLEFRLSTMEQLRSIKLTDFDINQHKNTYDGWIEAFENSIRKRTLNTKQGMFLGLSAGYDSGAISCELTKQNAKFTAYTILSDEDKTTIENRHSAIESGEIIKLTKKEYDDVLKEIKKECEDFTYQDKFLNYNIKGDKASVGLGAICRRANKNNQRIYFSGQGADEIISDYGHNGNKIYMHSDFGGKFPDDLNGFFPWHSFYDGTQVQYLNKEEYVAGSYGIETRYPFLDVKLVQEFLWLSAELKNKKYKAPLDEYLSINQFPFQKGMKTGFGANRNLA